MSVLYFLLLIGVLVLVHELGHFTAAKLLDFRVSRLSLGFGRPLLRVVAGETEYQLGIFPLGGYVRIEGEDPEERTSETDKRSFGAKPLWQRLVVVFAGPAANLLLPLVIYFAMFVGETELPAAVIGDVAHDGPAQAVGLRPGDRIVEIDGEEIRYWQDIETEVRGSANVELKVVVERGARKIVRFIEPTSVTRKRSDGRIEESGVIGIMQAPFLPQIGVPDPGSAAAQAGLATGDVVIALEGVRVETDRDLDRALQRAKPTSTAPAQVSYLRGRRALPGISLFDAGAAELRGVNGERVSGLPARNPAYGLGIVPIDLVVSEVDSGSPAYELGLRPGDAIVAIDDELGELHWIDLARRLDQTGSEAISIGWIDHASGEFREGSVTQRLERRRDEFGNEADVLVFGARSRHAKGSSETIAISNRFRYAVGKAIERTGETISVISTAFWSIARGQSPREELGGPITMYRAAAVSGERGFASFLFLIALISISVALINLLPIPVLDGGHLLVFLIEGVRGKKLTRKGHFRFAIAGYAVVGLFTVLAVGNDLLRFFLS